MRVVKLSNIGGEILVDDEDYPRVLTCSWCLCGKNGSYSITQTTYPQLSLASFIMRDNKNMYDHKDRNPYNNQKSNLRIATKSQNMANMQKPDRFYESTSRYKGVSYDKRRKLYKSRIMVNYKEVFLGRFKDEKDAARAYDKAALEYFGEFSCLNFKD